jgi:hypothetical protein
MGKAVPMASFRRATRPTDSAVAAFVGLGDAPGDTPAPVATPLEPSNETEAPISTAALHESEQSLARSPVTPPTGVAPPEQEQPLEAKPTLARAPAKWRRKTLLRSDGRELRKQTIYLDAELSHGLMIACAEKQYELSEAIEEAVNLWLKKRA